MIRMKELLYDEENKNRIDRLCVENDKILDGLAEVNNDFYQLVKLGLLDIVKHRIITEFEITQGYVGLNKNGIGCAKSPDKKHHLKIFRDLIELKNACYDLVTRRIGVLIPNEINRERFFVVVKSLQDYSEYSIIDILLGRHIANYDIFERLSHICNPNVSDHLKSVTLCKSDNPYDLVCCFNESLRKKLENNINVKKNLKEGSKDYLVASAI